MRPPLRLLLVLSVALGALAVSAPAGAAQVTKGFYVYKDYLTHGVVEFRDSATGRVLRSTADRRAPEPASACRDERHKFVGARWQPFQPYYVNAASAPAPLDEAEAFADVVAGHEAWTGQFVTDCDFVTRPTTYEAHLGGTTDRDPSLAWLEFDGENTVAFLPLSGTVCDAPGVVACVVAASDKKRFVEADMLIEADLPTRLGGDYRWTTGDRTFSESGAGELAVIDVVTHEWGHFAGLDHVNHSPELTMYPSIHDGMQTLGRGDMKGLLHLYPAPRGGKS